MVGHSNGSSKTSLEVMDWNDVVRERDKWHVLHFGGDAGIEGMCYPNIGDM